MITKRTWAGALICALVLHVALASYLVNSAEPQTTAGAMDAGEAGIEVGFGMAGSSESRPELTVKTEAEPDAPKPSNKVEPKPTKTQKSLKEIAPVAPKRALVEQRSTPTQKPKTDVVVPVQPDLPAQQTQPQTNVPDDAPTKTADEQTEQPKAASEAAPDAMQAKENQVATQKASGNRNDQRSGGKIGDAKSYFSQLFAWLLSHQQYPPEVKKQKIEGVAVVLFSFDKHGNVLKKKISTSSGNARLDQEALDMLERAAPLPSIPPHLGRDTLTLRFNAEFSLIKQ